MAIGYTFGSKALHHIFYHCFPQLACRHTFANDALIAHKMNVSDGSNQPYLQDTKPQN